MNGRVVSRPFGVHLLQLFEGIDSFGNGATKGGTILVVVELMYMASEGAFLVLSCI